MTDHLSVDQHVEWILQKYEMLRMIGSPQDLMRDHLETWIGMPISVLGPGSDMSATPPEHGITSMRVFRRFLYEEMNALDNKIQKADVVECLTSPYEYIRMCKKWYEETKETIRS